MLINPKDIDKSGHWLPPLAKKHVIGVFGEIEEIDPVKIKKRDRDRFYGLHNDNLKEN